MSKHVDSVARTSKLYCGMCGKKIRKGEDVVFELDDNHRMLDVYGECCKEEFAQQVVEDSVHPFSDEAF